MARAVSLAAIERTTLRDAGEGDAGAVAVLLTALGYPCEPGDAAVRIAAVATDPRQRLLLADCEDRGLGLLGLDFMYYVPPLGATTCRITALVVAPEARRCGLGRRLLREAERLARKAGASRMELTSAAHREAAHAFYRACGYAESSLRFVKPLSAS